MMINSGIYEGKYSEHIFLTECAYALWYRDTLPRSSLGREFQRLMAQFDNMPFTKQCRECKRRATRASAYRGSQGLMFWCDDCDPRTGSGLVSIIGSYREALRHIDTTANGTRGGKRAIIRELAEAKGMPSRFSTKSAIALFWG